MPHVVCISFGMREQVAPRGNALEVLGRLEKIRSVSCEVGLFVFSLAQSRCLRAAHQGDLPSIVLASGLKAKWGVPPGTARSCAPKVQEARLMGVLVAKIDLP